MTGTVRKAGESGVNNNWENGYEKLIRNQRVKEKHGGYVDNRCFTAQ